MTCTRYPDDDVVVRYVTGELAEPEQSAFEDHMFACDGCLARVERYQLAQGSLAGRELPAMPTAVPSTGDRAQPGMRQVSWWALGAVAAAIVAVLAGMLFVRRQAPAPTAVAQASTPTTTPEPEAISAGTRSGGALRVAVLAMVTPPPYLSITTRGDTPSDKVFTAGMNAYTRGDWAGASRGLRGITSPQGRFYLGIADLMRGDAAAAATSLEAVKASGRLPYARESLFYLGKAALQRGDVAGARELFVAARDAGAGPGGEAARLVRAIDELEK
ncbi:MAG TPA: hypothetical protein VMF13_18470 [Luteitalea sp.]|nr:hypothetical protein [Luteitalea sp.]